MQTVTVNKLSLIDIITKNRDGHSDRYEKAWAGYRKEAIETLEDHLSALKDGKRIAHVRMDSAPTDHTEDYDRVLEMLNMSVDDTIELSNGEFQQYVQDDWNWSQMWNVSNTKYLG